MVGDPQQSIYGERVNVQDYLNMHRWLVRSKRCEQLVFSETFRCPHAVVSALNARFPKIFNYKNQVTYVPLRSAQQIDGCEVDGCVEEITIPHCGENEKIGKEEYTLLVNAD
jgi:ATP-dependent exoDNAse (exonuclease V) beta subunit